jgi:adenylate cyclase
MKFSFRAVLTVLLFGLVLLTALSLGASAYWASHRTNKDFTLKILDQTSLVIDRQVQALLRRADEQGAFTERMFRAKALRLDDPAGLIRHFRAMIETTPGMTGLFLGSEPYGECLGLTKLAGDDLLVWELRRNPSTGHLEIREYLPEDFPARPRRTEPDGDAADTRSRPWYAAARDAGRQVWSAAYPYYLFRGDVTVPGITCATPLYGDGGRFAGVLGIDFRLDRLCDFLKTLRVGEDGFPFVVEVGPGGRRHVIAHPDSKILLRPSPGGAEGVELVAPDEISDTRVTAFMAEVPAAAGAGGGSGSTALRFVDGDVPFLGSYRVLAGPGLPTWLICTVVPEDEVLARARADARLAALIGFCVLLVAGLVSLVVSRNVSRSVVRLVQETEAVGRFEVEARQPVPTLLAEVDQLARATEQMKTGLRSFGKYVPTDLVRQLIAGGVEARPGGENRVVTVFFCDLAGFTSVSESLTPQRLVEQLGEYFQALTEEVAAAGGTVDKFIGDAVMAFWGAPLANPDHAAAACRCALACQRRLAELRASWKAQGKPLFFARIGINTGPVVVGNIGSARRLNYTVIGDAVNVASRLEGLNKFYGTAACVSEETFRAAGGAVVGRPVDRVSVKGKSEPTLVYELLALAEDAGPEVRRVAELHARGLERYLRRQWEAAAGDFEEVTGLRPGDAVAAEMARRCRAFLREPPGPDWDGVNHLDKK